MNPKTLQYLMGHSNIGVTMNVYTHLGMEDAAAEMARMEEVESARREQEKLNGVKGYSMFEIKLPEGFTHVKQIRLHKKYCLGFSYLIDILCIIQNSEGTFYLRHYTNFCDSGANGRPLTSIRDVCYKIKNKAHIAQINENNWKKYILLDELLHPTVIFESIGGTYVDQQALDFVKADV